MGGAAQDEARRAAATKKEVLRLTGTAMCELSFLFGLRQEGSLHALNKVTCLALQADAFKAISAEFPEACNRLKDRTLERKVAEADGVQDAAMLKAIRDLQGFSEKKIVGVTTLGCVRAERGSQAATPAGTRTTRSSRPGASDTSPRARRRHR